MAMTSGVPTRRYLYLSIGMLINLSVSGAYAELIRHDRDENEYAKRTQEPQFRCVGSLHVRIGLDKSRRSGSGVLISPRWVLTCAHVAKLDRQDSLDDREWEFGGKMYHPVRVAVHPSFRVDKDAEVLGNGWDLALVKLAAPVENVAPTNCYLDKDEAGTTAVLVGYGRLGDGINGPKSPEVKLLLAGENVIDSVGGKVGTLTLGDGTLMFDFDHPNDPSVSFSGDAAPLNLEAGMLIGDSGGGMFLKKMDKWYLAGLMAFSPPRSGDLDEPHSKRQFHNRYGQICGGIRISSKIRWINDVLGESRP